MHTDTRHARRPSEGRPAERVGRSLCRAAEWVADGFARWKTQHAPLVAQGMSPHVALAGAVGAATVALDVAAGPLAAPIVGTMGCAATLGIATLAVARVTARRRLSRERHRAVLAAVILHAERRTLCPSYAAEAWRIASGVPRVRGDRMVAVALARKGAVAVSAIALARTVMKGVLKRAPWISVALRIAQLPEAVLSSARLVAAVEAHAELLSGPPASFARAMLLHTLASRAALAGASNDNALRPTGSEPDEEDASSRELAS